MTDDPETGAAPEFLSRQNIYGPSRAVALTQRHLDRMLAQVARPSVEGAEFGLAAPCHPNASERGGVLVLYAKGVLTLACPVCGDTVARIEVAP